MKRIIKMVPIKRGGRRMENLKETKENELNEEALKELSNNKGDED
jgi:hypothetical protein